MQIEQIETDRLIPYVGNAKLHDEDQVAQLAGSIREFGFNAPILISDDLTVIAGHGRLLAARKLGLETVPCIRLAHLSKAERRAYAIADNRLAELGGGWDEEKLAAELQRIRDDGDVDPELTGFDEDEILAMLEDPANDNVPPPELTPEQDETLNRAWSEWAGQVLACVDALRALNVVSAEATPAVAKVYFLRALWLRDDFPRWVSVAYHPHRFAVGAGRKEGLRALLERVVREPAAAKYPRFALLDEPRLERLLKTGAPMGGARQPLDFPAYLARSLINEFTPEGGAVLDPCHGWGGRLVGFLLSHASHYAGFDPSPETADGVRRMARDFGAHVPDKTTDLRERCFEDCILDPERFDFAVTSPPYFDVERYTGPDQSHVRYPTLEAWNAGFYGVMIEKVEAALRPGGTFALQVGNQSYPLERMALDHAARCGLRHIETRVAGMHNNLAKTEDGDGEVIVILRKP